jgi:hypothetical protein
VPLLERRRGDEEGKRDLLGVLHAGREVDQDLPCHCSSFLGPDADEWVVVVGALAVESPRSDDVLTARGKIEG